MQWTTTTHQLTVHELTFEGRIDADGAPILREALREMTREGLRNFVVDLRAVSFIDSTGLGVLTSLLRAARSAGGDVCLVVTPGSAVHEIASLVRFDVVFLFCDTPTDALNQFQF